MKFINYLKSIAGVDVFPMISLLIFFVFFILLLWYVFATDRKEILSLKNIPLENEENTPHL
jgi:cytochrome c oxidase cbb3-type subunit III